MTKKKKKKDTFKQTNMGRVLAMPHTGRTKETKIDLGVERRSVVKVTKRRAKDRRPNQGEQNHRKLN